MKKQIKTPEKIQLRDEEIANLSDAEFKTLVIRTLTVMDEYGCKIEEDVNAMKSELKETVQGTKSKGKKTRTQMNSLDQKEEINIQPEQNKETRIQKNEERLRDLWDNFKCSLICKGNRLPGSPGSSESPKEVGPKEAHIKAHHNCTT